MSAPERVLEYINTIKWPIVGLSVAFWLRSSLTGLIGRLQSAKFQTAGVSAELEARTADAANAIDAARHSVQRNSPPAPAPTPTNDAATPPFEQSYASRAQPPLTEDLLRKLLATDPAVVIACALSADEVRRVQANLALLDQFTAPSTRIRQLAASQPGTSLEFNGQKLIELVNRLDPDPAVPIARVWPGTPWELEATFRQLDAIFRDGTRNPGQVSEATAREFYDAARAWADQYHAFLTSILLHAFAGKAIGAKSPSDNVALAAQN
ncbi:hypothetical protein [Nocardia sp. NPDC020380]|uniref:hypothetical protein n=1 Tax=Nocardia sp. NPDC020380 TaxID=3364309 RepID=UPI0037B9113E